MSKLNQLLKSYGCAPIPYGRKRPCSEAGTLLGQRPALPKRSFHDRYDLLCSGVPVQRWTALKPDHLYNNFLKISSATADGSGGACADVPAAVAAEIYALFSSLAEPAVSQLLTGGSLYDSPPLENNSMSLFSIEKELYIQPDKQILEFDGKFCDFDWYQGTIFFPEFDQNGDQITGCMMSDLLFLELKDLFPDMQIHRVTQRSVNKYATADVYYDKADPKRRTRLLMAEHGGRNPGIHCTTSGYYSSRVSSMLRNFQTRPSRVDVAIDNYNPMKGATYFDRISKKLLKFAKEKRLTISFQGDWYTGSRGRTLYVGSSDSVCQLCFYEKGLQLHGDLDTAPVYPHWCRFEFRYRPDRRSRVNLHKNDVIDWLGSTRWARELLQLLSIEVDKTQSLRAPKQQSSADRARFFLARQYGPTIEHWTNEAGGFANFAVELYKFLLEKNPELNLEIASKTE